MSLITCPECKNQVSDQADSCPKCGFPINKGKTNGSKIEEVQFTKKKHKKSMIWAALLGTFGFILLFFKSTVIVGVVILIITIIYSIIIRSRVFWDHD